MSNWTIEQVAEWLKKEGFEQFINIFKDNKIDGANLLTLNNETLRQLLSVSNNNEAQNQRLIDQFKQKLNEWKIQYNVDNSDRRRRSSAVRTPSTVTNSMPPESYTKNITLSTDMIGSNVKFFNNSSFRTHFQQYLMNTYNIECRIRLLETQEIYLTLNGIKQNVKSARETITKLFESIRIKIYEDENIDQQMIYWSQHITSDLIIPVIQQIMDQQNIFTLWEKTAMFYGYFKVVYFIHTSFTVSEDYIREILNNEIIYMENLVMPNEISKTFLKNIDQFIFNKQHPELAIIRCKYPYKLDIKISLFGRKNLVKKTKKQLQSIINKYTIKTFQLKMNSHQYEYLLDNCVEELKDIEEEYKDDNVKIRIRQKEFSAPEYLIEKIKKKITDLIYETIICQYQKIGNSFILNDHQNQQIQQIAKHNYCRIEKIDKKTQMEVYSIPKALSPTSNTSTSIIEQSNEFSSTLSMRKISVSNGSIEIYLTNQSISISRDVTVISSPAGAVEEGIEYMSDNGYFEMRNGRKILFHRWSPPMVTTDDKMNKKFKKWIEKFISSTLQSITTCCSNVEKIAFITNEWENVGIQQQQLVEYLISEIKQELEIRKIKWRILLIFNDKQINLYKEFYQNLIRLQTDSDGFGQFCCPITTIQIILATTSTVNLTKCENEMNNYIKKNILSDTILTNEIDLKQWDQYTINVLYKYCLNKSVLLKIDLLTNLQIQFIGSIIDVEKSLEKYRLMTDILKQRSSLRIPPQITPRTSVRGNKNRSNPTDRDSYNIYFSFCQHDQLICNRILTCLTNEGYFIYQTPSNTSFIDKSDIILIGFSEDYSNSTHSMLELNYSRSIKKKLIPFVIRNLTDENAWLSSLTIADLFYDLFHMEIDIEFKDDFDLEYDRLLSTLLHHTKPGITGITYPQPTILPAIKSNDTDLEEGAFGYKSLALQKVTPQQRTERERKYQEEVTKKIENEKIPRDEIDKLVAIMRTITDDLNKILRGEDLDVERSLPLDKNSLGYAHEFLGCIQRWLNKVPNVIRGNITPFTPTGDINDAIFIIHRSSDDKRYEQIFEPFDHSPPNKYFASYSDSNISFTNEQSHDYLQKLIQSIKPMDDMDEIIEDNEPDLDTTSVHQMNNEDKIGDELKSLEEMRKIEELDNPKHIWKNLRVSKEFIQLKIKNILELKELCEKLS